MSASTKKKERQLAREQGNDRKAIAAEAEKYGFISVDGALLVPPVAELYTDGLHPNDIGFSIYAENLIRIMENS